MPAVVLGACAHGLAVTRALSRAGIIDPSGKPWVIERTVGRTDFWVDLCIANSVNLPLIEYDEPIGREVPAPSQGQRAVWVNGSTDRAALAWYAARAFPPATLAPRAALRLPGFQRSGSVLGRAAGVRPAGARLPGALAGEGSLASIAAT